MDFEMFGEDSMMEGVAQRKVDSIAKPEKGSINQMNKKEFWQTIESVNRMVPDGNHEMVVKQMCEELLRYSPQDILDWHLILREYNRAAYRNDLWAACTALGAHASDDGFVDFRTWLISQGKNIYMDAMRDPDTLAANPHAGKEMNFEAFGSCAIDAYRKKLNLTDRDRFMKPYDDLDKHELSDQLVKDIQSEIPQHPDASSICLPRDYSAQFPHIWERMSAQSPGVSATKDAPDLARSTHRIFKINDLFGQQVALQPRVELYPATTEELALLRNLGEKSGVTLRIYTRKVTSAEEEKILHNAENKNRMDRGSTNRMKQAVTAEANLQDVAALIASMRKNSEPLIHCAVFIELTAKDPDSLRALRDEVSAELVRSKLDADQLFLRQREGFLAVNPAGRNVFATQFERVLPAGSVANLFPFNYSGKTDPKGFYVGRDRYGSNVIVDLDRRAEDKTTASVLILGNSGQGKSYLLKLLLCNILESGKSVLCLDPEHELMDLCVQLGGCFIDLMSGQYRINPLQPKLWSDDDEEDPEAPDAFRQHTRLSQHISFLKDFFRSYKDFADRHIDTIELMLERLYAKWGIDDNTEVQSIQPEDFPTLSDLYDQIEEVYQSYDSEEDPLYTRDLLREILLGLHSMCRGAESKFFNGHTNITSSRFLVFGVKGLLQANSGVKNAMLFNVLSYLSDRLLTQGNAVATLDELYIWLSNLTMPGCFRAVGPEVS